MAAFLPKEGLAVPVPAKPSCCITIRVREIHLNLAGDFVRQIYNPSVDIWNSCQTFLPNIKFFAGHFVRQDQTPSLDIFKICRTCPLSLANFACSDNNEKDCKSCFSHCWHGYKHRLSLHKIFITFPLDIRVMLHDYDNPLEDNLFILGIMCDIGRSICLDKTDWLQ